MELAAITIPVYKIDPDDNEICSFKQTLKIFADFPIVLFSPHELNIAVYENIALNQSQKKLMVERFDDEFFNGIDGYNKLLLSSIFYKRFLNYEYILICQLDAFVFKDELAYWCRQGFDYIGAPIVDISRTDDIIFKEYSGNGGFSLRKVKSHLEVLRSKKMQRTFSELNHSNKKHFALIGRTIRVPYSLFKALTGYKNNMTYFLKDFGRNEDCFWFEYGPQLWPEFSVAPFDVARFFAFEKNPSFLYEINDNTLPFGCHAFRKYEPDFWTKFINPGQPIN